MPITVNFSGGHTDWGSLMPIGAPVVLEAPYGLRETSQTQNQEEGLGKGRRQWDVRAGATDKVLATLSPLTSGHHVDTGDPEYSPAALSQESTGEGLGGSANHTVRNPGHRPVLGPFILRGWGQLS